MKDLNFNLTKKSLWAVVVYAAVIVLFVLVAIVPFYLANRKIAGENDKIKARIEEQKQLGPIYASILDEMKKKDMLVLPNPAPEKLSRENTAKFKSDFKAIADKSKVKLLSFTPNLSTLSGSSSSLLHQVALKGEFSGFQKLLIELGGIPYVDKIEDMEIRQNNDGMDLKMKVWVGLK
ncbi:MAG TPA: hypothetical protein PLT45_06245 [Smithella sp.]|nr:hypothetical protein [Smithella sp.]